MTGRVEELDDILIKDMMAKRISDLWIEDDLLRQIWKLNVREVKNYVFATDTTTTSNSSLPWKNKTTIPKLCQIADNLIANYLATMFPNSNSIEWQADELDSASRMKRNSIVNYMKWAMSQAQFKSEIGKVLSDYVYEGNCFVTAEWLDNRAKQEITTQSGFVGPAPRRIAPLDIVMNPTTESFIKSPKIVKSIIGIGELKELLERLSNDDNREEYEELWKYLKDIRAKARNFTGSWIERDESFRVAGFASFQAYLRGNVAEVLTFYGDLYDEQNDILLKNHVITVVDRHKIIGKKPNPSYFGYPPIFHAAWRRRPDNLWGMGPLENLVGMQYRLDHVENMKADVFDLVTYPVKKIKGFVEDFVWQPGENIYVSEEGDVDMIVPDVQALQANFELTALEQRMEEMAGAPREAMGFRTPGEKTAYEVQSLENAAARIFQNKIRQFEEDVLEPLLNAMLELARRNISGIQTIKVMNQFNLETFQEITAEDITGIGRIKPIAARHFTEQAQLVQNLTNLTNSNLWPFVQQHFSSIKLAQIVSRVFNLDDYEVVLENVALAEQADAQRFQHSLQEQTAMQTMTASGMGHDYDLDRVPGGGGSVGAEPAQPQAMAPSPEAMGLPMPNGPQPSGGTPETGPNEGEPA